MVIDIIHGYNLVEVKQYLLYILRVIEASETSLDMMGQQYSSSSYWQVCAPSHMNQISSANVFSSNFRYEKTRL